MWIERMQASFGKLEGEVLELREGLNILQAPNETGKSTWCAFLLAMLYGINTGERSRAGYIADKSRYVPWSGKPMGGRLDCRAEGDALTLLRATRRQNAPMKEFQAVYTGTQTPVPGLTGDTCGEALLGVTREVYARSAFIRQSGLPVTPDPGLERRVASLISAGEEGVSYSEAAKLLRDQLNRRRHNKTGSLPNLEAELAATRSLQRTQADLLHQMEEAEAQARDLEARCAALEAELAYLDRWDAYRQRQVLLDAEEAASRAEEKAAELRRLLEQDQVPENEAIGRLRGAIVNLETVRKSMEKALAQRDEAIEKKRQAEAAVNEHPFAGRPPEEAEAMPLDLSEKPKYPLWALLLGALLGLALGGALYIVQKNIPMAAGCACGAAGLVWVLMGFLTGRKQAQWESQAAAAREDRTAALSVYKDLCQTAAEARGEAEKLTAAADGLFASLNTNEEAILREIRRFAPEAYDVVSGDTALRGCAIRRKALAEAESAARDARLRRDVLAQQFPEADSGAPMSPPTRGRASVLADQEKVHADLAAARSKADQLSGRLHATGDPMELASAAEYLEEQIGAAEGEYAAIQLALTALEKANNDLQKRFSPALGQRAAEIFSGLTGGAYEGVALDRDFRVSAYPAGSATLRESGYLSAGAADQLYLAVRLAICDLVLPEDKAPPIVLDDALSNFDDARCRAALEWLRKAAEKRQILLFTCHSREADFFARDPQVSIQRLTPQADAV